MTVPSHISLKFDIKTDGFEESEYCRPGPVCQLKMKIFKIFCESGEKYSLEHLKKLLSGTEAK